MSIELLEPGQATPRPIIAERRPQIAVQQTTAEVEAELYEFLCTLRESGQGENCQN